MQNYVYTNNTMKIVRYQGNKSPNILKLSKKRENTYYKSNF